MTLTEMSAALTSKTGTIGNIHIMKYLLGHTFMRGMADTTFLFLSTMKKLLVHDSKFGLQYYQSTQYNQKHAVVYSQGSSSGLTNKNRNYSQPPVVFISVLQSELMIQIQFNHLNRLIDVIKHELRNVFFLWTITRRLINKGERGTFYPWIKIEPAWHRPNIP